jgi:ribose/xylose/arabinose/galactoside ABC-type transport system permease subunit
VRTAYDWFYSKNTILAFLVLFVLASVLFSDRKFLSIDSSQNILRKVACDGGIVALAMAFVIVIGEIDLSVGSTLALSAVIAAIASNAGYPTLGIAAGLATGLACGMLTGFMVAKMKISSWIASLAMMLALRGVVYLITEQRPVTIESPFILWFGSTKLFGFSILVFIYFTLVLLCLFIGRHTKLGTALYAVGGNEEAARMMGLRVDIIKIMAYSVCGFLCALAGILLSGRLRTAQATAGVSWETFAIASCALGGVKLTGGEGKFSGVMFGTLIVVIINTMFNYSANINTWWQNILMGVLVMISVGMQTDVIAQRFRRLRHKPRAIGQGRS